MHLGRLFGFEVDLQDTLAAAQIEKVDGEEHNLRLQQDLKDKKQQTESSVETMIDKCRELQGQLLGENLARMDELRQEQEDEIKSAIDEAKASLTEPRELWLRALICEADLDEETQGNLQAMGERHALSVAVSCLEAAGQRYYHEAAAEEKDRAEFESLALLDEASQAAELQQKVLERTSLLKAVFDEEFHRSSDALWAAFQQHLEACKRSRECIMEAQHQLIQNRIVTVSTWGFTTRLLATMWTGPVLFIFSSCTYSTGRACKLMLQDCWVRETQEMLRRGTAMPSADAGAHDRGTFAFSYFRSDWYITAK